MKKRLEDAGLRIEKFTSAELSDNTIREISDLFRRIFCNAYGQYLFYPSEGKPISPQSIFKGQQYISLDELDRLDPLPTHPITNEEAVFWHDPETTFKRFQEKFRHQAHLILIRKSEGDLVAMTFGYQCSLEEAFENEEWKNPHHYSDVETVRYIRDFQSFINMVGAAAEANRASLGLIVPDVMEPLVPVYIWNCVVLSPELQGKGHGPELIRTFFEWIRENRQPDALQIGEVIPDSLFHKLLKKAGAVDVPGALGNSGILLEIASLYKLAEHFTKKKS